MNTHGPKIQGVLIFADQSAEWRVAGLLQVDRLALALNEYVSRADISEALPVCVSWTCDQAQERRRLPQDSRLTRLLLTDNVERFSSEMAKDPSAVLVINTRVVVDREGIIRILEDADRGKEVPALLISEIGRAHV